MEPIIRLENVSFSYEQQGEKIDALKQINLEILPGEYVSILGHNGSGKSTLAKLLNGLLLPSEGKVWVNGYSTHDEASIWTIRQLVGMVFQNPDNQIVAATVEDDIAFGMENLGLPPALMEERIDEALRTVQLDVYRHAEPHYLSGGQKQRVAIAGIIAMRPTIMVLDEATSMLDPQGRKEVLQVARRLNDEEGMTVIQITHDMREAFQSQRLIVMEAGQIVMTGKPDEIFQQVERLQQLHLEVPFVYQLSDELRKVGIPVGHAEGSMEKLVEELCKLR